MASFIPFVYGFCAQAKKAPDSAVRFVRRQINALPSVRKSVEKGWRLSSSILGHADKAVIASVFVMGGPACVATGVLFGVYGLLNENMPDDFLIKDRGQERARLNYAGIGYAMATYMTLIAAPVTSLTWFSYCSNQAVNNELLAKQAARALCLSDICHDGAGRARHVVPFSYPRTLGYGHRFFEADVRAQKGKDMKDSLTVEVRDTQGNREEIVFCKEPDGSLIRLVERTDKTTDKKEVSKRMKFHL